MISILFFDIFLGLCLLVGYCIDICGVYYLVCLYNYWKNKHEGRFK